MDPALADARRLLKNKTGAVFTGRKRGREKDGKKNHGEKDDGPSKRCQRIRSTEPASAVLHPPLFHAVFEVAFGLQRKSLHGQFLS
jgi:hypothetical protein